MKTKRKQQITLPSLSFKGVEARYVKFLGKLHKSDKLDEGEDNRQAATTARVLNLEDWREYTLICPTLLVSALDEGSVEYVGKCFEVICPLDPRPGKRYREIECYEIEQPSAPKAD